MYTLPRINGEVMFLLVFITLSVCFLFAVGNIFQKVIHGFEYNFQEMLIIRSRTDECILVMPFWA